MAIVLRQVLAAMMQHQTSPEAAPGEDAAHGRIPWSISGKPMAVNEDESDLDCATCPVLEATVVRTSRTVRTAAHGDLELSTL